MWGKKNKCNLNFARVNRVSGVEMEKAEGVNRDADKAIFASCISILVLCEMYHLMPGNRPEKRFSEVAVSLEKPTVPPCQL